MFLIPLGSVGARKIVNFYIGAVKHGVRYGNMDVVKLLSTEHKKTVCGFNFVCDETELALPVSSFTMAYFWHYLYGY